MERNRNITKRETIGQLPCTDLEIGSVAVTAVNSQSKADTVAWQQRGACAINDADGFYPDKGGTIRDAKKICRSCSVASICLEYALNNNELYGVWGGLSVTERRALLRRRGRRNTAA